MSQTAPAPLSSRTEHNAALAKAIQGLPSYERMVERMTEIALKMDPGLTPYQLWTEYLSGLDTPETGRQRAKETCWFHTCGVIAKAAKEALRAAEDISDERDDFSGGPRFEVR